MQLSQGIKKINLQGMNLLPVLWSGHLCNEIKKSLDRKWSMKTEVAAICNLYSVGTIDFFDLMNFNA